MVSEACCSGWHALEEVKGVGLKLKPATPFAMLQGVPPNGSVVADFAWNSAARKW